MHLLIIIYLCLRGNLSAMQKSQPMKLGILLCRLEQYRWSMGNDLRNPLMAFLLAKLYIILVFLR